MMSAAQYLSPKQFGHKLATASQNTGKHVKHVAHDAAKGLDKMASAMAGPDMDDQKDIGDIW